MPEIVAYKQKVNLTAHIIHKLVPCKFCKNLKKNHNKIRRRTQCKSVFKLRIKHIIYKKPEIKGRCCPKNTKKQSCNKTFHKSSLIRQKEICKPPKKRFCFLSTLKLLFRQNYKKYPGPYIFKFFHRNAAYSFCRISHNYPVFLYSINKNIMIKNIFPYMTYNRKRNIQIQIFITAQHSTAT